MRVIIVGAGEVGTNIAAALAAEGQDVVVMDQQAAPVRTLRDRLDVQTFQGSGSNPRVLLEAGLREADMLLAVTDSDEVNIVACLVAAAHSPATITVARIRREELVADTTVLGKAGLGIGHVINPELAAAERIVRLLEMPAAIDVVDFDGGRLSMVALRVPETSPWAGRQLAELPPLVGDRPLLFAARLRGSECVIPTGQDDIAAGDILYSVVEPGALRWVAEGIGVPWEPVRRVTVAGATNIGQVLTRRLEADGYQGKLIEHDETRAQAAAEALRRTVVLNGSPTDTDLLLQENIQDCDAFLAVLRDDEANVVAALHAKRLGARRVISLTGRPEFVPLIAGAGVDVVISPRQVAVSSILHFVRRGRVVRVTPVAGDLAEVIEFVALETAAVVGRPLKDVRFPRHALVAAVIRPNGVEIATGDTVIAPGDRVLVVALKKAVAKLQRAFEVRFEYF
jgi:trk system potassium uptake protein TrkA